MGIAVRANDMTPRKRKRCSRHAFSLLELLMVLVILGLVAGMIIPHLQMSAVTAKMNSNSQNLAEINTAVERWWIEKGVWPADDLSDISEDLNYFPEGLPQNPVTGTAYTLDAVTHRAQ